jgi:hypothetical protein
MTSGPAHRPLPEDASIEAMPDAEREAVAASWRGRAKNELTTSTVFASLTRELVQFEAPIEIVRHAATAVADEVRHAEICIHVAQAYLPQTPPPEPSPVVAPATFQGDPRLGALLFAVTQSCINEGVATVYLRRCLDEAEHPLARAAVRDIFEDEIHHARFGWALLASPWTRPAWRQDLAEALPTLLSLVADAWVALHGEEPLVVPQGHGAIADAARMGAVKEALEELVVPGFASVGVDVARARGWLAMRRWPAAGGVASGEEE